MQQLGPKEKIGKDEYPIKAAGFVVQTANICKICHKKGTVETCGPKGMFLSEFGDHYSGGKNRRKKKIIKDMKLVRKFQKARAFV